VACQHELCSLYFSWALDWQCRSVC